MALWPILSSAYAEVEDRLFGPANAHEQPAPEEREVEQHQEEDPPRLAERRSWPRDSAHHRDRVWRAIESTPNFWTTLKPLEKGAIERLYRLTGEHNWEVFFMTQRPATAGGTVQWQTHKWLVDARVPDAQCDSPVRRPRQGRRRAAA